LTAASAETLIEGRIFMFLHSFKTKCVNMAVIHVLHTLKLEIWLQCNPVSKYFYYAIRP